MPSSDTPNQRLATRLLGEPVEDWVRARRPQRKSWRKIANELSQATDGLVDVSPQTLLTWFPDREDDESSSTATSTAAAS